MQLIKILKSSKLEEKEQLIECLKVFSYKAYDLQQRQELKEITLELYKENQQSDINRRILSHIMQAQCLIEYYPCCIDLELQIQDQLVYNILPAFSGMDPKQQQVKLLAELILVQSQHETPTEAINMLLSCVELIITTSICVEELQNLYIRIGELYEQIDKEKSDYYYNLAIDSDNSYSGLLPQLNLKTSVRPNNPQPNDELDVPAISIPISSPKQILAGSNDSLPFLDHPDVFINQETDTDSYLLRQENIFNPKVPETKSNLSKNINANSDNISLDIVDSNEDISPASNSELKIADLIALQNSYNPYKVKPKRYQRIQPVKFKSDEQILSETSVSFQKSIKSQITVKESKTVKLLDFQSEPTPQLLKEKMLNNKREFINLQQEAQNAFVRQEIDVINLNFGVERNDLFGFEFCVGTEERKVQNDYFNGILVERVFGDEVEQTFKFV
ncbi:Hypothetical_protein [Hexamita inflata]|uniref:Hypothetical_protein n=1 Tax=Hexamita inflata TaxID=28002 RepID=A0AA86TSK0_9EUKA|nr:Hypothetical protein HINF_LOCUS14716 [Hexamita inflata]